jgi:hypothetical protein
MEAIPLYVEYVTGPVPAVVAVIFLPFPDLSDQVEIVAPLRRN